MTNLPRTRDPRMGWSRGERRYRGLGRVSVRIAFRQNAACHASGRWMLMWFQKEIEQRGIRRATVIVAIDQQPGGGGNGGRLSPFLQDCQEFVERHGIILLPKEPLHAADGPEDRHLVWTLDSPNEAGAIFSGFYALGNPCRERSWFSEGHSLDS